MIERWTIWQLEPTRDGECGLQVSLALLDPATWEPVTEITRPVVTGQSVSFTRAMVRLEMDEWVAVYGIQLSLT